MEILPVVVFGIWQVSRSEVLAKANEELDRSVGRIRRKSLENIFGEENGTYSGRSWAVNPIQRI